MAAGITIDKTDLISVKRSMKAIEAGVPDAIRFATNNVLSKAKTSASKEIREVCTAKAAAVNKTITIKKMLKSDMSANLTVKGKPLPLINFSVSQVMRGVNAQVKKPGSRELIEHAFVATMKSGHKGVFWRSDRRRGTSKRFPVGKRTTVPTSPLPRKWKSFQKPIHELFGLRMPDVFGTSRVLREFFLTASDNYDARLEYHVQRLMIDARSA